MCGEEHTSKVFSLKKYYQDQQVDNLMLHGPVLV